MGIFLSYLTLAKAILNKLGYLPRAIKDLSAGTVYYSEEPFGILWELTESMKDQMEELKKKGCFVYAIIKGAYRMSDDSIFHSTTYLCLQ